MINFKVIAAPKTSLASPSGTPVNPISGKVMLSELSPEQIRGKNWLIRVDINGLTEARIDAAAGTIAHVVKNGGYAIVLSHNGRPKGVDQDLSLWRGAPLLQRALRKHGVDRPVEFVPDVVGSTVERYATNRNAQNPILLLENTRFFPDEKSKDPDAVLRFARQIVEYTHAEGVIINGFSAMHRSHASVTGIAEAMKEQGGIVALGIEAEKEITFIWDHLIANPRKPFVGLLGGAKVSGDDGKLKFLHSLLPHMDAAVIGGALLWPFLVVKYGKYAGKDPIADIRKPNEPLSDDIKAARELLRRYESKLILPTILFDPSKPDPIDITQRTETDFVMRGISEEPLLMLLWKLDHEIGGIASAIVNGTFSYTPDVTEGTYGVLGFVDNLTKRGALTIAGGGDTEKAIKQKVGDGSEVNISFRPTGGGAMLDLLSNRTLPAIEVLSDITP